MKIKIIKTDVLPVRLFFLRPHAERPPAAGFLYMPYRVKAIPLFAGFTVIKCTFFYYDFRSCADIQDINYKTIYSNTVKKTAMFRKGVQYENND